MSTLFSTPAMLALDALFIVYTFWVLSQSDHATRTPFFLATGMTAWLLALYVLISGNAVFAADISGLAFYVVVLLGVSAVGGLLFVLKPLRSLLAGLDQGQLMLLQGIRVYFGAAFLIQGGLGLLPEAFGMIDGLTHVSAGFFGLIAAYSVTSKTRGQRRIWFANLFGLADILIVATSLAFVLLPAIGPHHPMMYAVFLPAPFWLWFHAVSIAKLLTEGNERSRGSDRSFPGTGPKP